MGSMGLGEVGWGVEWARLVEYRVRWDVVGWGSIG